MTRLRNESGVAVVVAVMVMTTMVTLGLATFALVDTQSSVSTRERSRESTYNYGEGVLNSEAFIAGQYWPGVSSTAALPDCSYANGNVTSSNGDTSMCPSAAALAATFNNLDYSGGVTWTGKVRDNSGTDACQFGTGGNTCSYYYSDSLLTAPRYDANGDNMLWVRSRLTVGNSSRTQVALVQVQKQSLPISRSVLSASSYTSTWSPKLKIFPNGGDVLMRCPTAQNGTQNCMSLKNSSQVPASSVKATNNAPAMNPSDLDLLRQRAKIEGGWSSSCPSNPTTSIVFIESGPCSASVLPATSPANPAVVVIVNGALNIGGGYPQDFYGLIYLVNQSNSSATLFSSVGLHRFHGAINVDGPGGVSIGTSSQTSLSFDQNVYSGVYAYANGAIVRPSYREIQSSNP